VYDLHGPRENGWDSAPEGDPRSDYLINSDLCPYILGNPPAIHDENQVAMKMTRVTRTQDTLLLTDGACGYQGMIDFIYRTDPGYIYYSVRYRHSNKCNVAFVDSHVERMNNPGPGNLLDVAWTGSDTYHNCTLWK
jgi:prepilin-type processing-associated H-X9-DG protein